MSWHPAVRRWARLGVVALGLISSASSALAQNTPTGRPTLGLPRSPQTGEVVGTVPQDIPNGGNRVADADKDAPLAQKMPGKTEAPKVESAKVEAAPCDGCNFSWLDNPPVRLFPRVGNFGIPPSGPGYYSLLDVCEGNCRNAPPKFPYGAGSVIPFSFFDADFRYLDNPNNTQHDWADVLHRHHVGDNWLVSTGGEVRWRFMNENNSRLTGMDNNYDLFRARAYLDVWYRDTFRVYVEGVTAQTLYQNLKPLAIDENRGDFQNAFVDLKIAEWDNHAAYLRVGRQELLLGSQRLISPLDWANTRRIFDGVRVFRQGEKCDFDFFWAQPVVIDPNSIDSVDHNRNFGGAWFTYRPQKGQFLDLYYLFLDDASKSSQTVGNQPAVAKGPYNVHTLGGRSAGDQNHWLWDVEGMFQLGEAGSESIIAGAVSAGGGYNFSQLPLNPSLWVYYDYATGDRNPGVGHYNTFNQLFPFGHYYLGALDLVGRQNIHDLNAHLVLYPAPWMTVNFQYHHFTLDSAKDFLYSAGGAPLRRDPTGQAGRNVGDEFDVFMNFHLGAHSDLLVGYAHLQAGDFIRNTASTPAAARSPELVYVQYSFRW